MVAADDPDTAANIVHPSTVTCSSRPGSSAAQGDRPLKRDSERRLRNKISAIRTNSVSAMNSGVVTILNVTWLISFSIGRSRKRIETDDTDRIERDPYPDAAADQQHERSEKRGRNDSHRSKPAESRCLSDFCGLIDRDPDQPGDQLQRQQQRTNRERALRENERRRRDGVGAHPSRHRSHRRTG